MGDLSIQNLTVEYASGADTVRPIDGLNLDVAAGSLVILMGPSGCGKTTLLSCLGGILRPSGRRHQVRRRRRHISRYPRTVDISPRHGGHRVPGVQSRAQPHRDRERDGADECRGHVAPRGSQESRTVAGPRRPRGADDPPARGSQRWTTTARGGRKGDRARPAPRVGRRAHRASGLHSGRGSAATDPRTRHRRPDGGRRDARQPHSAAGRSRRRAGAGLRVRRIGHPRPSSWRQARCCSSRARWVS